MAHKVLSADMANLVQAMKLAQEYATTLLDGEYRRGMLQAAHVLAVDAKHLLDTIDAARKRVDPIPVATTTTPGQHTRSLSSSSQSGFLSSGAPPLPPPPTAAPPGGGGGNYSRLDKLPAPPPPLDQHLGGGEGRIQDSRIGRAAGLDS